MDLYFSIVNEQLKFGIDERKMRCRNITESLRAIIYNQDFMSFKAGHSDESIFY